MGSFANSVFNMLLGWIRAAASSLWGALTGRGEDFLTWIGENWLAVTIAICAVCTLIDVVVHILRWRPHRVWASFFRRLRICRACRTRQFFRQRVLFEPANQCTFHRALFAVAVFFQTAARVVDQCDTRHAQVPGYSGRNKGRQCCENRCGAPQSALFSIQL